MKTLVKISAIAAMLPVVAQATTSITGTLGSAFKASDGLTNIPSGALVMLVADVGSNGFLNLSAQGRVTIPTGPTGFNGIGGKTITSAQAGLTAGSTFGGDTIVSTTSAGASGSIANLLTSIDISSFINLSFAVVWFNQSAANIGTNGLNGQVFGMMSLADWKFPSVDNGTAFPLSSTDAAGTANYYSTSASMTGFQLADTDPSATQTLGADAVGFFTGTGTAANSGSTAVRSATFTIVPEPSAALLGAIGVLGLLRRRRN